jgi:hypothetical protein
MTSSIQRIHDDLRRLQTAKATHQKAAQAERKAAGTLKHDRDLFDQGEKELKHERPQVPALRQQLDSFGSQQSTLSAQLAADPANPQLQQQLAAVEQREAAVQQKLDAFDALKQTTADRGGQLRGDEAQVKRDNKTAGAAANRVKGARARALKDLRPAEYKLGLKATNALRQTLGLRKVDHVVRPGVPNVVGGQVGRWIAEAQTVLKQHGVPLSKMNARDIDVIIQHESAGNPKAVNRWDSNAAAGHPSEGLMQTIGPTFNSYKLPGHSHILNPIDNIIAGVRYAISRYGSISSVPGVVAVHHGRPYVGY